MLKWLVQWLNRFFKRSFSKKQGPSLNHVGEHKVVQPPPELTNADLEFLFTQLLEGVHQARGQQWALKYLQRMENRITLERWIDWLLDFGEKLLTSHAPHNQLAERLVQLGELGIGTIGELAYDIGIRLLTRNLGEQYWYNDRQDTETKTAPPISNPLELGLTQNYREPYSDSEQDTETTTTAPLSNPEQQELIWEYVPDTETTTPAPLLTSPEEEAWVEKSLQAPGDESSPIQPTVSVTLDELLVSLEESTNLAQQLANGLGLQTTTSPVNTELPTNQPQAILKQAQVWFYQGLHQAKTGDLSGAIASYNKAIEIYPDSHEYWFNRGLTLFYLGYFPEAIASYDKAIEIKPDFYKGWYNRGGSFGELGYFEDAIACFDKALEIKFDYPEAWSSRGMALVKLGCPEDAVSSYDTALLVAPEDQENWYHRGIALALSGRTNDAIASYDKAIEIQPDFHKAWYNRGVELSNLGRFEDAIASFEQATLIEPDEHETWYALGSTLDKLGQYEQAIASYDQATLIQPDLHEVWIDRGVVLANLGRWYEAISSWQHALEIKPDFYLAWFNQAVALENLGRREEAIASYDQAIEINPDFYLAWYNRAVALFYLERFEEAIASYDGALQIKLDYWEAWIGRGTAAGNAVDCESNLTFVSTIASINPALNERGYEGKLASYESGLKYVFQDTHLEGWGRLHLALGNAHYDYGKRHPTPCDYWYQAVADYNLALTTATPFASPELHLEVLQNLIKTFLSLGEVLQAQQLQQSATDLLWRTLSEPTLPNESKKQLALKNAGFGQLAVEIAVQSGELAQALEIAEHGKNTCLTWLLFGWSDEIFSPTYRSIQKLLNPTTAIIYWHISPCALHTFILKYKSPEPIPIFTPVLNVAVIDEMPLPEAVERLVEFQDWLEDWNEQYREYRHLANDTQNKSNHSWHADMEQRLLKLKNILNISAIKQELEDITQLILIPHQDLHRFPLHALFNLTSGEEEFPDVRPNFTTTYLPSIQIGLSLKSEPLWQAHELPLLSVEYPESTNYPTPKFAKFESEAISQMFNSCKRIQGSQATKKQVENALSGNYNIFHFTGYVSDNFSHPQKSELALAGEDKLTLAEICEKQIASYNLITLSTCETAINSNQTIATEYVGLVTAFLSQGVAHVVSTLWTVESAASALVIIEFYRRLQQDKSAATALAEATEWLKELTAGDLKKWFEELLNKLPQEGLRIRTHLATELYRISKMPPEKKLYNDPYYWAAFIITGKFFI